MNKQEIESYLKAGEIVKKVVAYAREFIKPGMLLIEIAEKIDDKIKELGGDFGFPVNLSLNETAAHYTPGVDDETKAGGLLKIDLGVSIEGYIADVAFSLDLTKDKKFKEMIELNEKGLDSALSVLKKGTKVNDIGKAVHDVVKDSGFNVVKNLSGHSLGKNNIHAGLTIPNYKNNNENELKGAFAIEPFLTTGVGEIYEGKPGEIFMLQKEGSVRDSEARKILKFVKENYDTRPFCSRWLVKEGFKRVGFALKVLTQQGILHNFPVLIEKSKQPVSQAEHSVLITDDEVLVLTRG